MGAIQGFGASDPFLPRELAGDGSYGLEPDGSAAFQARLRNVVVHRCSRHLREPLITEALLLFYDVDCGGRQAADVLIDGELVGMLDVPVVARLHEHWGGAPASGSVVSCNALIVPVGPCDDHEDGFRLLLDLPTR